MSKILFVVSGVDHWELADGTMHPTGYWAEEVVVPHETFTSAGHDVVIATPGGAVPQVDQRSLLPEFTGGQEGAARMVKAVEGIEGLHKPIRLEDVDLDEYQAVYYPGGHGPMEDLAVDQNSGQLLVTAMQGAKPLGIVCHGPAAMLAAVRADGANVFAGRRVTGFTNEEEAQAGLADKAKWLLQDRLVEIGTQFQEGEAWAPHVIVDGNLVTGQNPASSAQVATELLRKLA